MKGFRQFLLRGNVVDLAVGVVIGAAFVGVVAALVKDILSPLIAAVAKLPDFSDWSFVVNGSSYMDFTKFVSMLSSRALFFSRADQFSDQWEGAKTVQNVLRRPTVFGGFAAEAPVFHRALRLHTFISCWHLSDIESAAMWKLYVSQNDGIAVQTTFAGLTQSFTGDENDMHLVHVGKVVYLNYEEATFQEGNTFVPFLHKRLSSSTR